MINYPTNKDRISIIGRTGSGKTQAAIFHLSLRDYHRMPWIVYNFKYDESVDGIPGANHIGVGELPYSKSSGRVFPGIYIVHPFPDDQIGVENQMQQIWAKGNTGVYVDEGYMIGTRNPWFRNLLTQGRSKHIPMIVLSQRPTWMDRFVFSESNYFQVFDLTDTDDLNNVRRFIRETPERNLSRPLPEFHSYYYDVKNKQLDRLKPVPDIDTLYKVFDRRLGMMPHKKVI